MTAPRKSFAEMQRDAAVEQAKERSEERRRIEKILFGDHEHHHERLGELVRIGDDYVAEIIRGDHVTWTTVIGDKARAWHHYDQESAILHLIAQRYDPNDNSSVHAAFYAGRVLGIQARP